jgi:hypothetical protein
VVQVDCPLDWLSGRKDKKRREIRKKVKAMCDWHLEPERAYKITYRERAKDEVLVLHVLANNEAEARAITSDVVDEIIAIEEL